MQLVLHKIYDRLKIERSRADALLVTNRALEYKILAVQYQYEKQRLENNSLKLILTSKEQEYAIIKPLLEERDRQIATNLEEISLLKTSNLELKEKLNPDIIDFDSDSSYSGSHPSLESIEKAEIDSADFDILDSVAKD